MTKLTLLLLLGIFSFNQAYAEKTLSDPTRPATYKKHVKKKSPTKKRVVRKRKKTQPLELQAILYSPSRQIAIINQQRLKVGDSIHRAKVLTIDQNSVKLRRRKKDLTLRLMPTGMTLRPKYPN